MNGNKPDQQRKIRDKILEYGGRKETKKIVTFTSNKKANELILTSATAFLFGVLFDQGVPAERAWEAPYHLKERLGHLDLETIVRLGPEELSTIIMQKPALHRYRYLGRWIFEAAKKLLDEYEGDAWHIWKGNPPAATVVARLKEFKGIGQKKASMATNILVRDLGVQLKDKRSIDVSYDIHVRRVFLRTGLIKKDSRNQLIKTARTLHPEYPGALDLPCWLIGRQWCHPYNPDCKECPINSVCPKNINIVVKK